MPESLAMIGQSSQMSKQGSSSFFGNQMPLVSLNQPPQRRRNFNNGGHGLVGLNTNLGKKIGGGKKQLMSQFSSESLSKLNSHGNVTF